MTGRKSNEALSFFLVIESYVRQLRRFQSLFRSLILVGDRRDECSHSDIRTGVYYNIQISINVYTFLYYCLFTSFIFRFS